MTASDLAEMASQPSPIVCWGQKVRLALTLPVRSVGNEVDGALNDCQSAGVLPAAFAAAVMNVASD